LVIPDKLQATHICSAWEIW